jgi:hypothetical protein
VKPGGGITWYWRLLGDKILKTGLNRETRLSDFSFFFADKIFPGQEQEREAPEDWSVAVSTLQSKAADQHYVARGGSPSLHDRGANWERSHQRHGEPHSMMC